MPSPHEKVGETIEAAAETFRREISDWLEQEKSGERKTGHFTEAPFFNVDELTMEDVSVWNKFENGELTQEELREYGREVHRKDVEKLDTMPPGPEKDAAEELRKAWKPFTSRGVFQSFLNNQFTGRDAERMLAEFMKQQGDKKDTP